MRAASLLREARRRAGLTQAELARRAGTTQSAVSAYESGVKDPTVGTLDRLLRAADAILTLGSAPETMREYLREHPVDTGYQPWTIARTADRVRDGEDFWFALRELLDDLSYAAEVATVGDLERLIAERPVPLHPQQDAFLAALAEHRAAAAGLPAPAWTSGSDRFLDRWWFAVPDPAFEPRALVSSPAAFRRRGVFIDASLLERR